MRIKEAIAELRSLKPNQYSDETLVRWLSELDGKMYETLLKDMETPNAPPPSLPYRVDRDLNRTLIADFPHEGMYISYLSMQIDFHNGEYTRYNNEMLMFNAAYQMFADDVMRTHMHRQDGVICI